ncbi:MAG: alpha-ketoglutarate-dependent taurine dioxygenase [Limisphaerales bacterium]|jgi:alpha-ketoglutarate-dependent taurine dioxygenase
MSLPFVVSPQNLPVESERMSWVQEHLNVHGALLLRGFGIESTSEFEAFLRTISPELANVYRGTAPRNAKSQFVYSSTELSGSLPIPQHLEMSFLEGSPSRLFFYCHVPPEAHGETPIVDFKKVYEELDLKVKQDFENRGVRHIRNYNAPGKRFSIDLSKLKTWDQVYGTTDVKEIGEKCRAEGQKYSFRGDRSLKLINKSKAFKSHPITGDTIWFNHTQVFHPEGVVIEAEQIAKRQKSLKQKAVAVFLRSLYTITKPILKDERRGTQVTFGDKSKIPIKYIKHIQDVIWKNMVFFPWQRGDILVLDNYRVSHGRMPFKGAREIQVAWTN